MALERELETFQRELPRLLADAANRGKHALVHGDTAAGIYGAIPVVAAAQPCAGPCGVVGVPVRGGPGGRGGR